MKPHEKFLQFKGRNIYFKEINGEFYIAIKPICDVLNVNYNHHLISLKNDYFFGQLYCKYDMVGADNRKREMICLPEKYIYGWILTLNSQSNELKEYKKTCYDILFNYFNGAIIGRKKLLQQHAEANYKMAKIEKELMNNDDYLKLLELKQHKKELSQKLKMIDQETISENYNLFNL